MGYFSEGAYNKLDLFILEENEGGTAYDFLQLDLATAAVDYEDAALTLVMMMGINVTLDDAGVPTLDLEQEQDDADYEAAMVVMAPPSPTGTSAEVVYVDGTKRGGSIGNGPLVLAVGYGPIQNSKRKVFFMTGRVAPASRGFQWKSGESSKPPFKITGEALKYATDFKALLRPLVTAPSTSIVKIGHAILKQDLVIPA
jgi:hypothetical protein